MSDLKPEQTEDGVRIPANVLAQVQEADRLQKSLSDGGEPAGGDDVNISPSTDLTEGAQNDPEHPAAKAASDGKDISSMTPEELAEELRQAQHKFSVLQGKYNKEVKEVAGKAPAAEISELKQELTDMKNMIATMAMTRAEAPAATADHQQAAGDPDIDSLKDEDFEDYGDEMKSLVKAVKALAKKNGQTVSESDVLRNIVGRLERTEQVVAKTEGQKFFDALTDAVPTWRPINKEPEWVDFLKSKEPMTGVQYQVILTDAQQKGDIDRIKRVFESFPRFREYDEFYKKRLGIQQQQTTQRKSYAEPSSLSGIAHPSTRGADLGRLSDTVSKEQLEKASRDVTSGRLSEQEFDKIANIYQKQLAEQLRIAQAKQRKGPGLGI